MAKGDITGYLGRYHNQISVLKVDRSRKFLGWLGLGFNRFSVTGLFASRFFPHKKYNFTTDRFGGIRTMIPFDSYDKVMAFDLMPAFLLRALLAGDTESAMELGCLELSEEDLALCTFVCPSKNEYGPVLRSVLDKIEKEG
jgi:Na+-transporting NADH:ubiquinone oxidoreductase subunit A